MKKIGVLIIFLLVWQWCATLLSNKIFPLPTVVFHSMAVHAQSIFVHCAYSVYRLILGIFSALILGVPLGILLAYYKKIGAFFTPVIYVLSAMPKVALLPLIMLSFGIGNRSKIFIIFLIVVFQIIVTVFDAVRNIPAEYFVYFKSICAGDLFILKNLLFQMVLADVFTALRIALATSISVLFFAETFGTRYGLGFYVMDMWMRFDYVQMYGGILMLGLIGLCSLLFVNFIEHRICAWKKYEQ